MSIRFIWTVLTREPWHKHLLELVLACPAKRCQLHNLLNQIYLTQCINKAFVIWRMKLWILPCTCTKSRHATATKTAADFIFLLILHRLLLRRFRWWFSSRALEYEAVNEWVCVCTPLFICSDQCKKRDKFPISLPLTEPHSLSASS